MDANKKLREIVIAKMQNGDYKLKPCPFCGGEPVLYDRETFEMLDEKNGSACITIECNECKMEMYEHTHDEHNYYVRLFMLVDKWNRRA